MFFVIIKSMKIETKNTKLEKFQNESVTYVETVIVKDGVFCDIYKFNDSEEKDLAIVTVSKGCSTPLQRVEKGDNTVEGYVSGKGVLVVNGKIHKFPSDLISQVDVFINDTMQWQAEEELKFFEICYPSYKEGRFTNLEE